MFAVEAVAIEEAADTTHVPAGTGKGKMRLKLKRRSYIEARQRDVS